MGPLRPERTNTGAVRRFGRRSLQATLVTALAIGGNLVGLSPASATTRVALAQCINGTATSTACAPFDQTVITSANSHYKSDQVVPQRAQLFLTGAQNVANKVHTVTFSYDTRIAGVHAYDSLATWNLTQTTANHCTNADVCPGGTYRTFQLPSDPTQVLPLGAGSNGNAGTSAHELPAAQRLIGMYGGYFTSVSAPVHSNAASATGDDTATFTVQFTVPSPGTAVTVHMLFGGHLAPAAGTRGWGTGEDALSIPSAANVRLVSFDGVASGLGPDQFKPTAPSGPPGLKIDKAALNASVSNGDQVGYKITTTNTGQSVAHNVIVNDTLPGGAGLSWSESPDTAACAISSGVLTCNAGDLAPGASFITTVVSPTTAATPASISNTAKAHSNEVSEVIDTEIITVKAPNLTLTKTADNASVASGSPVGFTVTIGNTGLGASYATKVSDPLPGASGVSWSINPAVAGCAITGTAPTQTLSCDVGTLNAGASKSVRITSATTTATAGTLDNTASGSDSNGGGTPTAKATIKVGGPKLMPSKTADNAVITATDDVGYTIKAMNGGNQPATDVVLEDLLPGGAGLNWVIDPPAGPCVLSGTPPTQKVTCNVGTLAPGATFSAHVSSHTTTETPATITNELDTKSSSESGTAKVFVSVAVKRPNLVTSKVADAATVSSGDPLGFTITTSNTGDGTAKNVVISDPLPAATGVTWSVSKAGCAIAGTPQVLSCTAGNLAAGSSYSVKVTSASTADTTGTLSNTATTSSSNFPDTTGTATITVQKPSVSILKTADNATTLPGVPLGFTMKVSNAGPGAAKNLTLADPLPFGSGISWNVSPAVAGCTISGTPQALSCSIASIASGASYSVHVVSTTDSTSCGTYPNTATVSGGNLTASSSSSASSKVVCPPVLKVSISNNCPTQLVPGGLLSQTIAYQNTGTGTASAATLVATLSAGQSLVDGNGGTVTPGPGGSTVVTWDVSPLAAGASGSKTIVSRADIVSGPLTTTAVLSDPDATAATTSLVSTVDPSGQATSGAAYALDVDTAIPMVSINEVGRVDSQSSIPPGAGPDTGTSAPLGVITVPGLLTANVIQETATSSTGGAATTLASSTVAGINVLGGEITSTTAKAVSRSTAVAFGADSSSDGTTFENLVIDGNPIGSPTGEVAPNTHVDVFGGLLGLTKLAEVTLREESAPNASLVAGKWQSSQSVNLIHVKVLAVGATAAADIIIGHVESTATFPSGLLCNGKVPSVSGEGFVSSVGVDLSGAGIPQVSTKVGDSVLPAYGGNVSTIAGGGTVGTLGTTGNGTSNTNGAILPTPNAHADAGVSTVGLFGGIIKADALQVVANSEADGSGSATTTLGTTFVKLSINGNAINVPVAPNTVIRIPQSGQAVLIVILNEQLGSDGPNDTFGTVNAIHATLLDGSGGILAEAIVGSAHSDAHKG
jgi:uncharacterized repeat protein (TIGR01451 family)